MSETPNQSPPLDQEITEVQGHFQSSAALEVAMGELMVAGFDRADLSLPNEQPSQAIQTPTEGADNPVDEIDKSQLRTMGTSMAGYAGAVAAAGVTLATGGAAGVALAAAAAVGTGGALLANSAGNAADKLNTDERDERGAAGKLILAVRTREPAQVETASAALRQAGATDVQTVKRGEAMLTAGVSAASWTGG